MVLRDFSLPSRAVTFYAAEYCRGRQGARAFSEKKTSAYSVCCFPCSFTWTVVLAPSKLAFKSAKWLSQRSELSFAVARKTPATRQNRIWVMKTKNMLRYRGWRCGRRQVATSPGGARAGRQGAREGEIRWRVSKYAG